MINKRLRSGDGFLDIADEIDRVLIRANIP